MCESNRKQALKQKCEGKNGNEFFTCDLRASNWGLTKVTKVASSFIKFTTAGITCWNKEGSRYLTYWSTSIRFTRTIGQPRIIIIIFIDFFPISISEWWLLELQNEKVNHKVWKSMPTIKELIYLSMKQFISIGKLTVRIEMNDRSKVTKSTLWGRVVRCLKFVRSTTETRSSRRILSATYWRNQHP